MFWQRYGRDDGNERWIVVGGGTKNAEETARVKIIKIP